MMKSKSLFSAIFLMILVIVGCSGNKSDKKSSGLITSLLQQEFDHTGKRSPEVQYYLIETELVHIAPDGKRSRVDTLRLLLETIPARLSGKNGDEIICRNFEVQIGTGSPAFILALEGWSYIFKTGVDEQGQVFGIDHERFENLKTGDGRSLPPETAYFVYNTFIDFHGFCDVFARPIEGGKGIQDLRTIGDKIVHAAAFTEPPVNLGSHIAEGSTFKNGEVTLEFKGLSFVDNRSCSVIGFDSGESTFNMIMQPMPTMQIKTSGSSHYKGDLYIDLESNWVQKVVMGELVVSETKMPTPPYKVHSVVERSTIIRSVKQIESQL